MRGKVLRYLVVGVIAFGIDFSLTLLLASRLHHLAANTLGFVAANMVNFLLAHRWVFNRPLTVAEIALAYPAVLAVSIVGLVLSDFLIFLLVDLARLSLAPAKLITTALVLLWNFLARAKLVYAAPYTAS
jgi:putative flippase GtrA